MPAPYDSDALWQKAQLFLNHAMDEDVERSFDERAMWAALALELLAKAALASSSPLLIAAPNEEGVNLLAAAGLVSTDATFKSITARTLYSRCERAFRPFNKAAASRISESRNDYLHGSSPTFVDVPPDAWWPRYWTQAIVLVNAFDQTIDDLVGPERSSLVDDHLARNKANIEVRVEMKIDRARQRLGQQQRGDIPARVAAELSQQGNLRAGLVYSTEHECPACKDTGILEGDTTGRTEIRYEMAGEDDFDAWVDVEVYTDHFSCETCRLVLTGYEQLEQAGLPTEFEAVRDISDFDGPDYGKSDFDGPDYGFDFDGPDYGND